MRASSWPRFVSGREIGVVRERRHLEQIRLWGQSFGELLMYDTDGNDLAVRLGATRFGLPPKAVM